MGCKCEFMYICARLKFYCMNKYKLLKRGLTEQKWEEKGWKEKIFLFFYMWSLGIRFPYLEVRFLGKWNQPLNAESILHLIINLNQIFNGRWRTCTMICFVANKFFFSCRLVLYFSQFLKHQFTTHFVSLHFKEKVPLDKFQFNPI